MRRSVSILAAAAMVAASAAGGIVPAEAAPIRIAPPVAAEASAGIVEVRDRYDPDAPAGAPRQYNRRYYNYNYNYHHRHHVTPFFFGFPFAFSYQAPRRDCFRTFDGRVYCRAY